VILDDKFSSIVKAIMWGRSVYDNIRKFLQFQLTVNVVALALVFIGAVCGFGEPLNAVQMLWVNLVMDTLGALALGTEAPTPDLLRRRPYKRQSSLLSWPMWRNILLTGVYELLILLLLLFIGADVYGVHYGESCLKFDGSAKGGQMWNPQSKKVTSDSSLGVINCKTFAEVCPSLDRDCFEYTLHTSSTGIQYKFYNLLDYEEDCLKCVQKDYTHGSIIFNAFIFMQFFNQYVSRRLFAEIDFFAGLDTNWMFFYVSIFVAGAQIILIELAGDFLKTSPLNWQQWLTTIALGFGVVPCGIIWRRLVPLPEDPNSFFSDAMEVAVKEKNRGEKSVELV
jgi:Ca2+-transporting ATPase